MQSPINATKAPGSIKNASAGRIKSSSGPQVKVMSGSKQDKSLTTTQKG